MRSIVLSAFCLWIAVSCSTDTEKQPVLTDTTAPLHLLQADHGVPYGIMAEEDIMDVLFRVLEYLDRTTPKTLINKNSLLPVSDYTEIDKETIFTRGDYRLISYEWGVTYGGMLLAGEITGDKRFTNYSVSRLEFLSELLPYFKELYDNGFVEGNPMRTVIEPRSLDDSGAMAAAMIKAVRGGYTDGLDWMIRNYVDFISNDQLRLSDGTLARHRPQPYTLWLDDLFMSVPALAQMGVYTGDDKYFDDAVLQVKNFADYMFNWDKGLYMHGYVTGMDVHPEFRWARANGWAIMTKIELLDVLPASHPGYDFVVNLLQAHVAGLAEVQSGFGFWHQLLDRSDSYLETSATAIFTYSMAKAINEGWIDGLAYGPVVSLAWNAVSTKINAMGQVEGTCVGTGMAFDPAFYYARPVNVFAAHSYGPVMLAGAEMIRLYREQKTSMNDSAFLFYDDDAELGSDPIFYVIP
ncbi:glycoside hydrolase family 88/105 protein [Natronoflexus pectinivorans]|uniref:Rhamnogalacturonyl hydrolase YesR n=1 Tax=Natronoflexus pectinivorans TaxID=682526 RepID=A0A4V2RVI5_9BACT|nr:glycoside hydrolase family 88 protein [Natronoflexus pectinivorans]TCO04444.1 rhamnogalacturonyl hydrolase YesR [Natronoflexus pectinivorans]